MVKAPPPLTTTTTTPLAFAVQLRSFASRLGLLTQRCRRRETAPVWFSLWAGSGGSSRTPRVQHPKYHYSTQSATSTCAYLPSRQCGEVLTGISSRFRTLTGNQSRIFLLLCKNNAPSSWWLEEIFLKAERDNFCYNRNCLTNTVHHSQHQSLVCFGYH